MFETGSLVVYGTTGVCRIQEITTPNISGVPAERLYYVLKPCFQDGGTIFTPVDNEKTVIRAIMTKDEAERLISEMPEIEELWVNDNRLRDKLYRESIRSADPREWVKIIKTSFARNKERVAQGKKATATDERFFKTAETYLYTELSLSLDIPLETVGVYIKDRIGKDYSISEEEMEG